MHSVFVDYSICALHQRGEVDGSGYECSNRSS